MFIGMTNFSGVDRLGWPNTSESAREMFERGKVVCKNMFISGDPRSEIAVGMCSSYVNEGIDGYDKCKFRKWCVEFELHECVHPRARELEVDTEVEIALERI